MTALFSSLRRSLCAHVFRPEGCEKCGEPVPARVLWVAEVLDG